MAQAKRDQNNVPTLLGVSNVDGSTPVIVYADPVTHRILVDLPGGSGTVSSVSVVSANGFAGTVATATTTPAITLSTTITGVLKGNGTSISAASAGTDYVAPGAITTSGLTMTTAKILGRATAGTGAIEEIAVTGSGSAVLATTPTLVTPVLGVATATSINKVALTAPASSATLTIADGKTATVNNSITFAGTDSTTMTFPTTTATVARTDAGQTFTGTQTLAENASIGLDPAGSADGKYTGITVTATAGYTQAFGDLVYIDPTDSRWEACDANSAAGSDGDSRGIIGIVVVAGTDGNACTVLLNGIIRADAKFPTFTVNNPIYVSETAGLVTQTQPSTADVVIRVVGFALTADEMYFNPSSDYITHT